MNSSSKISAVSFFLFATISVAACKDLFETDISGERVEIYSPADSFVAKQYDVVFWWKEVKDAKQYRLQIVSPSFDNIQQLIIDSVTSDVRITLQLYPGQYQWRLRAENGTTSTPYETRTVIVDTNSNLNGQSFYVNAPVSEYYSASGIVNFSWPAFPYATAYEYVLLDNNGAIVHEKAAANNSLSDTINEGSFSWKVRAVNEDNNTATEYSTPRILYVDKTPPNVSIPYLPESGSLDTNSVTLSWIRYQGTYKDSVFLAKDSFFQNMVLRASSTDTSLLLQPLTINQTYYWRLKSIDKAGNASAYSSFFSFTIEQ